MNTNATSIRDARRIVRGWAGTSELSDSVIDVVARSLVDHCGGFTGRGCDITDELTESFDLWAEIDAAEGK